jgi:hypothetical protein
MGVGFGDLDLIVIHDAFLLGREWSLADGAREIRRGCRCLRVHHTAHGRKRHHADRHNKPRQSRQVHGGTPDREAVYSRFSGALRGVKGAGRPPHRSTLVKCAREQACTCLGEPEPADYVNTRAPAARLTTRGDFKGALKVLTKPFDPWEGPADSRLRPGGDFKGA